jgi:hypothetical protein
MVVRMAFALEWNRALSVIVLRVSAPQEVQKARTNKDAHYQIVNSSTLPISYKSKSRATVNPLIAIHFVAV